MKVNLSFSLGILLACGFQAWAGPALSGRIKAEPFSLPGGGEGIGFDDLGYLPAIKRVVVPGGRTGHLFLIDPETHRIERVDGFSAAKTFEGGHGDGTTSADEGEGFLFAIDRSRRVLVVADAATKKILSSVTLAGGPDYVRYLPDVREVWVTEPGDSRIEIFKFAKSEKTELIHSDFIDVRGGPESLVIDRTRSRAFTHLWSDESVAIDSKTHKIAARWPNGCGSSRGIALDEKRGFLFAGCEEGKVVSMDVDNGGKILGSVSSGSGVDIIGYSARLAHLYLPGAESGTLAVIAVASDGKLSVVDVVKTARGSHCVTTDERGQVWVCDPKRGQLLLFTDVASSAGSRP